MLAARSPSLHGVLLAAKAVGYDYVTIDGTLIETDRCALTPGPTEGPGSTMTTAARPGGRRNP